MARLVHALVVGIQRRRRQHADGTGQHGSFIRQDVTEHVVRHHHVELLGRTHQLHGSVVDVHVAQFNVWIALGHVLDHFTPQLAGRQDVGLVHRAQLFATHSGHVEADAGDAADFAFAVGQRVVGLAFAAFEFTLATRGTEVDATGQLANDEDIQTRNDFRLERRRVGQLRVEDGRTQVGEQAQLRADLQQAALRADVTLDLVPLRATHGAQQHGIGLARTLQGFVGQRHAVLVDGRATDHVVLQAEAELELVVGQLQHLDRLGHDFRTNAIAWENQNLLAHAFLYPFKRRSQVSHAEKYLGSDPSVQPTAPAHRC
ncbi:hypothetical protein D3C81_1180090 [compost metagenome]